MHITAIRNRNDAIAKGCLIPLSDKASIESGLIYPITIGHSVEWIIDAVTDATSQDFRRESKVSAWATRSERVTNTMNLLRTICEKALVIDATTQDLEFQFKVDWQGYEIEAELFTGDEGLPAWLIWTGADKREISKSVELVD